MTSNGLTRVDSTSTKSVSMCADDFGLSPAIDSAILELAKDGRLQAISCMSGLERWPDAAVGLREAPRSVSVGLHVVLTSLPGDSAAANGPGMLLARAVLGAIDRALIARSIDRQLDRFEEAVGRRPDHVDGHQHVHAMPRILEVLVDRLVARYGDNLPWIRVLAPCLPTPVAGLRGWIIAALGRYQNKVLAQTSFRANTTFGGVRNFQERLSYEEVVAAQLSNAGEGNVLFMCHPALDGAALNGDEIAAARPAEYAFLAGPNFPALLSRMNCRLGPPVLRPLRISEVRAH